MEDIVATDAEFLRQELADLNIRLAARDAELSRWRQQYLIVESLWTALQRSRAWRLLAPLRMLRHWLAPRGFDEGALIPWQQLQQLSADSWRSHGTDPQFFVPCLMPAGPVRLQLEMTSSTWGQSILLADFGDGFCASECLQRIDCRGSIKLDLVLRLPRPVRGFRFDPLDSRGDFQLQRLRIQPISWRDQLRSFLVELWRAQRTSSRTRVDFRIAEHDAYEEWRDRHALTDVDRNHIRAVAAATTSPSVPLISVLLPLLETTVSAAQVSIASVLGQLTPHWQLCIAAAADGSLQKQLAQLCDPRIRTITLGAPGNRGATLDAALALASGDYCAVMNPGDRLAEHALYRMGQELRQSEADCLYSDEDAVTVMGRHVRPFFKPDWSPELLLSHDYLGGLSVFRTSLVHDAGGFRSEAAEYELALQFRAGQARVQHVAEILYHSALSNDSSATDAGKREVLARHLESIGRRASVSPGAMSGLHHVRFTLAEAPRVSIVIPCAGRPTRLSGAADYHLTRCVQSIRRLSSYGNYDILVVHDDELPPDVAAELKRCDAGNARIGGSFTRAATWNQGAAIAGGDFLVFMHDDVEVQSPNWLETMLEYAVDPMIGVVGARLSLPDGRLQHSSIALIDGIPSWPFQGEAGTHAGYFGNNLVPRNCSAVSGACLLTRRDVFNAVGGFTEAFGMHHADVDYCLKVQEAGKRIVVTPYAQLIQHTTRPCLGTYRNEQSAFRARWNLQGKPDPYHSLFATLGSDV